MSPSIVKATAAPHSPVTERRVDPGDAADRAPNEGRRSHSAHLDGLRGLAALYVVVYHACGWNQPPGNRTGLPSWLHHLLSLATFGQAAVAVFIVLSGYCLMLPVVQSGAGSLRGGLSGYLKRRAGRILPPYYGALLLTLLMIAVVPGMGRMNKSGWDLALPGLRRDVILSHLLLIHNFSADWAHKIDPPMWSIATEWQIYFIFPLVLLPLWRRFGIRVTAIAGLLAGIAPHWLLRGSVDDARFEFVGLFAFGMAGAVVAVSTDARYTDLRLRTPWGAFVLILMIPIALLAKFRDSGDWCHSLTTNITVGLAAACLLVHCARSSGAPDSASRGSTIIRILQWRPIEAVGDFSYSLYLVHAPVLAITALGARDLHLSAVGSVAFSLFVSVPVSVIAAFLFFHAFERPFLSYAGRR